MNVLERIDRGELVAKVGVVTEESYTTVTMVTYPDGEKELLRLARLGQAAEKAIEIAKQKNRLNTGALCINLPPQISYYWCMDCVWRDFCRIRKEKEAG